jgi:hypothetical protein
VGGIGFLIVFLIIVVFGQAISGIGLLVERHATPYAGLLTFIFCYFATFWMLGALRSMSLDARSPNYSAVMQ